MKLQVMERVSISNISTSLFLLNSHLFVSMYFFKRMIAAKTGFTRTKHISSFPLCKIKYGYRSCHYEWQCNCSCSLLLLLCSRTVELLFIGAHSIPMDGHSEALSLGLSLVAILYLSFT